MKRLVFVAVFAVALMLGISVPALAADLPSDVGSYKFYDLDMDGVFDWDAPRPYDEWGINGWLIELYKYDEAGNLVKIDQTYTHFDPEVHCNGVYWFRGLLPGTYVIKEAVGGGLWLQTFPANPNFHTVTVTGDGRTIFCYTPFGNVYERPVTGYTMGFWSNKNGLKALEAYVKGGGDFSDLLDGTMTVESIRGLFRGKATARDMCVMLKAQYVAHWLNTHVPVNGRVADYSGAAVVIDGQAYDYDDLMDEFAQFDCSTATRAQAEWWKDLFDGLNNNRLPVNEYKANSILPSF